VVVDTPDRIIVAQRGETKLPTPLPAGFAGFAGSIGINVLVAQNVPLRVGQNCFYSFDANGRVKHVGHGTISVRDSWRIPRCASAPRSRPAHLIVNETSHEIYIFSNDGTKLLKTLKRKVAGRMARTPASRRRRSADGGARRRRTRQLSVMIFDRDLRFRPSSAASTGPGQFNGIHAIMRPGGPDLALDRSNGRINVFRTTSDPAKS
jgi:hypothetical protein